MSDPSNPLRLEVVGVLRNGRRRYDPASKRRLVEACLQPGVSLAGLALHLQRQVLPDAAVVLDWFDIAMRFEHVPRAAAGLGAGSASTYLGEICRQDIEPAKWRLWHGRWKGCLIKLAGINSWTLAKSIHDMAGVEIVRRHLRDLTAYLEVNRSALVNYSARRRRSEPISTAFVESAVNEIISRRMIKKQQMRWNRWTVQPFLDVRAAVLNGTLEGAFRRRYPSFRPSVATWKPQP